MNTIPRFVLDDKRNVIDVLNPSGRKGYCQEGEAESQIDLRERILMVRLGALIDDLIVNLQPEMRNVLGERYQPFNHESHSIWVALFSMIKTSQLNALDPELSIKIRAVGKLRQKEGLQACTSLSLFTDDVERLLRNLYGDIEHEALDPILRVVFVIVQEFTPLCAPRSMARARRCPRVGLLWLRVRLPIGLHHFLEA